MPRFLQILLRKIFEKIVTWNLNKTCHTWTRWLQASRYFTEKLTNFSPYPRNTLYATTFPFPGNSDRSYPVSFVSPNKLCYKCWFSTPSSMFIPTLSTTAVISCHRDRENSCMFAKNNNNNDNTKTRIQQPTTLQTTANIARQRIFSHVGVHPRSLVLSIPSRDFYLCTTSTPHPAHLHASS